MRLPLYQIDAFTNTPFTGNPAAVCLLSETPEEEWLQKVAAEMNLSETAFLQQRADGYDLRWFTPTVEVDLCGHATLASAHALWESGRLSTDAPARFRTRSGLLTAVKNDSWIEMDFPADPPREADAFVPPPLAEGLGVMLHAVYRGKFDYLVEVEGEEAVRNLKPDFDRLAELPVRGIIVTSRADDPAAPYDFVSRFFGPATGVNEDPVTGSAHCALGPYWSERLGKGELVGYQASPRGGSVRVRPQGDRVILAGQAVTVLRGELLIPEGW
ncbi:MAG: PhzF family phenazine biosynthesis protein [Armatimonadetes bacterium]|nr:PhzF family phenazine biosynthesis protein [Armatimonadota bacterium]